MYITLYFRSHILHWFCVWIHCEVWDAFLPSAVVCQHFLFSSVRSDYGY